jgi:hypothetical protein
MGFCRMKPNRPVPVIRPMVVATALPNATSVKIVPWIRSSHRRNVAILEVGWGVVERLAFIAIFPGRLTIIRRILFSLNIPDIPPNTSSRRGGPSRSTDGSFLCPSRDLIRNPPDGDGRPSHRECWLRDPDGNAVVLASPDGSAG